MVKQKNTYKLDYPCVNLGEQYHITKNSDTCLCGINYQYGAINMNNNFVVTKNLRWLSFDEITCKCKEVCLTGE